MRWVPAGNRRFASPEASFQSTRSRTHEENLQTLVLLALLPIGIVLADAGPQTKRVGMVIGVKPDKIAAYKALHAPSNPGVRDLLRKYHMKNFSIFLRQLDDGTYYLFGYYEYDGSDYDGDMARLAAEKRNIDWLAVTGAMQTPLRGRKSWAQMDEVYHNE
jgi:L-rhamnose mutarotase